MLFTHRALQHRARAVVALLVVALTAWGLAACGDSDGGGAGGGSTADAETLLTRTFTGAHEMSSGRVDLKLTILAEGDPSINGPIELLVEGPFQTAGDDELPKFDLAVELAVQGQRFKAGLISTSDRLFVEFGGTAYEAPAALIAQLRDSYRDAQRDGSGAKLDLAGLDPMSWLEDPTVVGAETAGGVESDHIASDLDIGALLDDLDVLLGKLRDQLPAGAAGGQIPERIPADTRRQIEDAVKQASVDVWTGQDDKNLRKLALDAAIELPESSDGPSSIDVDLTFELHELNEPQTIEAPETTRPLSELLGQLQGLLGGALGGGALGGDSGSGAAENIDEYTTCLQDAGSDVTKAQRCAELLTP